MSPAEDPPDAAGVRSDLPSMAGVLLAVVVGAVVVLVDLEAGDAPLLPDPIGWALVGLGAWRLRAPRLREGSAERPARRRVGYALLVLAVISLGDAVGELAGLRPVAEDASAALAVWDAGLLVATVAVAVTFLRTLATWTERVDGEAFVVGSLPGRLRRSAAWLGVSWGLAAVGLAVAAVVVEPASVRIEVGGARALALGLGAALLVLLATLGYAAWLLLVLRGHLRRGVAGPPSRPGATPTAE